jgi:hypothetical protein
MPSVRHALRDRPGSPLECAPGHDGDDEAILTGIRLRELDAAVTRGLEVVKRGVDSLEGLPDLATDRQTLPQATQQLTSNRLDQRLRRGHGLRFPFRKRETGVSPPIPLPHVREAGVVAVLLGARTGPQSDHDAASPHTGAD